MAPVTAHSVVLTGKENNKLRKPAVEKKRRDRINSSIQQLKCLLEKELQAHQPSSKLEKADILETAVSYLKENMRPKAPGTPVVLGRSTPGPAFAQGFTTCLQETLCFLSTHNQPTDFKHKLVHRFSRAPLQAGRTGICPSPLAVSHSRVAPMCVGAAGAQPLWRPW
ncbi:transcription factor HES-5-like [Myripristis murdjan]|uniref:Transcription factor HES-5 n=1 Tax=Myripristis murdjan TaxID=586833 RepID=A0A667WXL0_9TELE|nr:transcription factor HES-5-like [Myripristis murdjan]